MRPEPATEQLSGELWRHIVIVAAMVSAVVAGLVAHTGRTLASEPTVTETTLRAPAIDASCRELVALPKWGWVCVDRRP